MTARRETSADSAARFLASRGRRAAPKPAPPQPTAPKEKRPRAPVAIGCVEKWRFVEKHVPGCWSAWIMQVGLPDDNMSLGLTGRPYRVNATDERCFLPGNDDCQCHVFVDGSWRKRSHRKVECCARFTFGDERHDPTCPRAGDDPPLSDRGSP